MKLKRAICIGVANYALSFLIGIIGLMAMGVNPEQMPELSTSYYVIGIIISVILAGISTLFYFKGKVKSNAKEGFYFGLVLIAVGFILDMIIFIIMLLAKKAGMDIFAYYAHPMFWLAIVLLLATTTIIGAIKKRK